MNTTIENNNSSHENSYKITRLFNWIVVLLISGSMILSIMKLALIALIFQFILFIIFVGSAIIISPNVFIYIFGMPLLLNNKQNILICKILFVANIMLILFGFAIFISSLVTGQYLPSLSGLLFILLPLANIRAIRYKIKSNKTLKSNSSHYGETITHDER
jgi:hypothetical protein